jgi:hypothetical protein
MATGKVHKDDTYTDFQLLVEETDTSGSNSAFNLGDASALQMVFTDPDGDETTVSCTIVNSPGTDGIMRFINSGGTLVINITGLWKYRAKLTLTSGGLFQSNEATFEVL